MDLDKRVFLDSVDDRDADEALKRCSGTLWSIAVEARHLVAASVKPADVESVRRDAWIGMMMAALAHQQVAAQHMTY